MPQANAGGHPSPDRGNELTMTRQAAGDPQAASRRRRRACLVPFLVLALVLVGYLAMRKLWPVVDYSGLPPNPKYEALIDRLRYAHRSPVRIFGVMNLYHPKEDETVRDEVVAQGRDIVPYLARGLSARDSEIRRECAVLLGVIPSKQSLEAVSDAITREHGRRPPGSAIHRALRNLVGFDCPDSTYSSFRTHWAPWWQENKDRIVNTDTGIALKNEDDTLTPLPPEEAPPDWPNPVYRPFSER